MKFYHSPPARHFGASFPGRIAGASLKLFGVIVVEVPVVDFPRQNRRGLIEVGMVW